MIVKGVTSMKINPYAIRIGEIITTLQLLESPEEHVVQSALCEVDTFINKYTKQALVFLQGHDIVMRMLGHLDKSESTRLLAMKILTKLLALESTVPALRQSSTCFDDLFQLFMQSNSSVELEYSSKLLGEICEDNEYGVLISTDPIMRKLFYLIQSHADPDVQNNCLKMLLCIVSCRKMRAVVGNSPSFKVMVLNPILQSPLKALRVAVVDILLVISDFNLAAIQKQLHETNTVLYLFDILLEEEWTMIQNKVLSIIYNCIKYNSVRIDCLQAEKFHIMVNLPKDNPNINLNHVLGIISVIQKLAADNMYLQVLIDYRVYEVLHEYCKFDCDMIPVKYCEALADFAKNYHVMGELANKTTLKEIEKILRRTHLPWKPYRQGAIKPLYLFLMNDPRLSMLYYKYNIIKPIQNAILSKDEMNYEYYKMALKIFQSLLLSKCLFNYLWNSELYQQFVLLLNGSYEKLTRIAISVLQNSLCCEPYRRWFLEFDGAEKVAALLSVESCKYIKELLCLLKCATKYKEMCLAVIEAGLVQVILEYRENYVNYTEICDFIMTDIYRIELSIKYYVTGFLDFTERIQNGFCAYSGGYRPLYFPPHDVIDSEVDYTMLTVNFHGDKQTRQPCVWGHISIATSRAVPAAADGSMEEDKAKATSRALSARDGSMEEDKALSTSRALSAADRTMEEDKALATSRALSAADGSMEKDNAPQKSLIPQPLPYIEREPKMIYKLEVPETIENDEPMPDYYLKKYLQSARKILNRSENNTRIDKLQALARFVACSLSGHENEVPLEHQFQNHLTELKDKLMSNYIPLGYIRMGGMFERALLFKVLADQLRIPCTLERGNNSFAWNEVCIDVDSQMDNSPDGSFQSNFVLSIVDLMDNVGTLMSKDTDLAQRYCLGSEYEEVKKYQNYNSHKPSIRVSSSMYRRSYTTSKL